MAMTRPVLLFAPGAGAPSSSTWMQRWKSRLSEIGDVHSFDYPYMNDGRRRPDLVPVLIAAHREALAAMRTDSTAPTILVGKSMGGRVGCHVALEDAVQGVVCFGYPLCAGGDRTKMRDSVLRQLHTPVLFVQGTRDPLCPLDLLDVVRGEMQTRSTLHVVNGGDHSLLVSKRILQANGETQDDVETRIVDAIRLFVDEVASG